MKIGLDLAPAAPAGSYIQHLAKVLRNHAPEHDYVVGPESYKEADLYHGFSPGAAFYSRLGSNKTVFTLCNLNFLRYPHLYSLPERIFLQGSYRRSLRRAGRVIVLNTPAGKELSERLEIDPARIEVVLPLSARVPDGEPDRAALERVRRKYALPEEFILILGTVEPRHNHEAVFDALFYAEIPVGAVVCGRRTAYSDFLLGYARERHMATRVEFIYELSPEDLPALFRLARAFAYLPDAAVEASIVPVVEALRAGLPMLLSDTPVNREAAGDAAIYVDPERVQAVAEALGKLLFDEGFRQQMQVRESLRAELFSEYAVAERLMQIYTSL